MKISGFRFFAFTLLLTACSVGPDYVKPKAVDPVRFKESAGWKLASPQDLAARGEWWEMFCDSELNRLESLVVINNQNVKVAEANYRAAQALVAQAQSSFFPTIGATVGATRSGGGGAKSYGSTVSNSYTAQLNAAWELDVWGKIRRTVEANEASAQASAADLAAAQLSAQGDVAINYLSLRVADEQIRLLDETVKAYQKSLELTQNLYTNGINARSDYLQAKVQLESAQAQEVDVGVQRTAYEHAIAVLVGKAPADFSIPPSASVPSVPLPPISQPSQVLERRPDVAGAERRTAAANAQIGVAEAAFYPDLTLSASGGYSSSSLAHWFSLPTRLWSIGPSVTETIFDAGLRQAQTAQAIAQYDQTVATYRQTVLGAFQEVEDNLAALTILQREQSIRNAADLDARASTDLITNQYKEGITSYLNVVTAQTAELNNALSSLAVKKSRLTADVTLIKALGGKWTMPASAPVTAADFAGTTLQPVAQAAMPETPASAATLKKVTLTPPAALLSPKP